jgi:sulfate permease, SulP family
LTTSVRGAIAVPQDTTAAVLALAAAGIAARVRASAAQAEGFWTVVAAIAITSLVTGLFFLVLGRFKVGSFIRFVPYPVVGGFLAGTGWLLMRGAINLMTGFPVGLAQLPRMVQLGVVPLCLPGAMFGVILLAAVRRVNSLVVMPVLVAAMAAFYGVLLVTSTSLADAGARGWLLGPFPTGGLWSPPTGAALSRDDWQAITAQATGLGTVPVLGAIALLLNASGLELSVRRDIDLDRELESAGLANLAAGLGGSPVGYHALSFSILPHRLGANARLAGLLAAG